MSVKVLKHVLDTSIMYVYVIRSGIRWTALSKVKS